MRRAVDDASLLRLGTALAIERNEQWVERRYVNPQELAQIAVMSAAPAKTA